VGPELQGKDLEQFLFLLAELDLEDRISYRAVEVLLPSGKKVRLERFGLFCSFNIFFSLKKNEA